MLCTVRGRRRECLLKFHFLSTYLQQWDINMSVTLKYWFWSQNYNYEGIRSASWTYFSGQITSNSLESLAITALFSSDLLWDTRDRLLILDCLGNMMETSPGFQQQCILLISMKIRNFILLCSSYPNYLMTLPCDDYVLWKSDWGLPQMWLYESLVKEFLYRGLEGVLGVVVMEGVYLYAASVNQRLLLPIQEA